MASPAVPGAGPAGHLREPALDEAIALRRCDLDLAARTASIHRQYVETNGHLTIVPQKSRAGIRTVAFLATLVPELREHLDAYVGPDSTALVFTGQRGGVLRRGNFRKAPAGPMLWPR